MESVALFLQTEALKRVAVLERDQFGRSSYSRYYYAVFLITREMLRSIDGARWGSLPHANYPDVLSKIATDLEKGRYNAARVGDSSLVGELNQAKAACRELANLMQKGYAIRVTADYHPEIPVDFSQESRFKLNSVSITDVHQWPAKARILAQKIRLAWGQVHD